MKDVSILLEESRLFDRLCAFYDLIKDVWRMPVKVRNGTYKVWTGRIDDYIVMHFTDANLPDLLKERLATINGFNSGFNWPTKNEDFEVVGMPKLFMYPALKPGVEFLPDVGYRVNEEFYCVFMNSQDKDSLKSEWLRKPKEEV